MEEQSIQDYVNEIYAINYLPSNKNIETLLPKISNVESKILNKLLNRVIKKHPYIYLSDDAEAIKDANLVKVWNRHRNEQNAKRKSYFEKRCKLIEQSEYSFLVDKIRDNFPYDYEELLNLAVLMPSWMEDHEYTVDDIIKILIYIGYPLKKVRIDRIKAFIEFAHRFATTLNVDETMLTQLFLYHIQNYKLANSNQIPISLSQFYPFTDENMDELAKCLIGEYSITDMRDGVDCNVYADYSDFIPFAQTIVDAVVPKTYYILHLMIKRWILHSKEQVLARLGLRLTERLYQNIDCVLSRMELSSMSMTCIDVYDNWGNYETYDLCEYIKDHPNDLTQEIINELAVETSFSEVSKELKDDMKVSSFRADILAMGVKDIELSWENVEFCKSYVVIHLKLGEDAKDFTYRLACDYSSSSIARIISENEMIEYVVNNGLPKIHCAFNRYGIIAILNKEQTLQSMQAIAEVCEIIEPGVISSCCNSANSFLLSLKNQCYDFLVKQSLSKYETVLLKEKSQSHSGTSQEENAAIFVVKDDGFKLHVVYESECLARSTYVFVTSKDAYLSLIRAIKKYFMSNEANKRQKLISDASIFRNIDGVFSVRRINHNNMDSWRMGVMR